MNSIRVPVSVGELLDKITILEIKSDRIADAEKRRNVAIELEGLVPLWLELRARHPSMDEIKQQLRQVNERMWDVQESLRAKEAAQVFDDEFIRLARAVGHNNGQRVQLKNAINQLAGSAFFEEKEYLAG